MSHEPSISELLIRLRHIEKRLSNTELKSVGGMLNDTWTGGDLTAICNTIKFIEDKPDRTSLLKDAIENVLPPIPTEESVEFKVDVYQGHVIIDFGKLMRVVGMKPKEASELADLLNEMSRRARGIN